MGVYHRGRVFALQGGEVQRDRVCCLAPLSQHRIEPDEHRMGSLAGGCPPPLPAPLPLQPLAGPLPDQGPSRASYFLSRPPTSGSEKPLDCPAGLGAEGMYGALSATFDVAGTQFWEGLSDCPGSAKPHPSLRPEGSLYSHESPSDCTRVNLRVPPPPTTCAQIPGTLSIKNAEQISFTLIRTRKI